MITKISVITSLYNCRNYINKFLSYLGLLNNLEECEFVFIHNLPEENEVKIINEFISQHSNIKVNHIKLGFLETLYASWNRGIFNSTGKYIAIWNVDDIRTPNSLSSQARALDENEDSMICYGDFCEMKIYGIFEGKRYTYPKYEKSKNKLLRGHYIGCFPMWRREIHDKIGYFDEQYKLVGDYEFQIRAARKYDFIKVNQILGYYSINRGNQLSSNTTLQNIERTTVEFRYGVYDKLNLLYLLKSFNNYHIYECLVIYRYTKISYYFKNYLFFIIIRAPLIIVSLFKLPRNILSIFKHSIIKN
jgi:hypothetical protein